MRMAKNFLIYLAGFWVAKFDSAYGYDIGLAIGEFIRALFL